AHYTSLDSRITTTCHSYIFFFSDYPPHRDLHSFPTRRSSDLPSPGLPSRPVRSPPTARWWSAWAKRSGTNALPTSNGKGTGSVRSEEHTSELQSLRHLVCRLLLEKKKKPRSRTDLHAVYARGS